MANGQITAWMPENGYGLITPDDGGEDVFFHESRVNKGWKPRVGERVTFSRGVSPNTGRSIAENVEPE